METQRMTYSWSGTPNTWLGSGGLRGGDTGGWALGFTEALNLLSYLAQKQREDRHLQQILKRGGEF